MNLFITLMFVDVEECHRQRQREIEVRQRRKRKKIQFELVESIIIVLYCECARHIFNYAILWFGVQQQQQQERCLFIINSFLQSDLSFQISNSQINAA